MELELDAKPDFVRINLGKLPEEAGDLPWTEGGKLCLELILREIVVNGRIIYAKENIISEPQLRDFIKNCPGK